MDEGRVLQVPPVRAHASRGPGGSRMRKVVRRFVQICASQNNLFALDEEGDVYQYHFNVKTWVKLTGSRESQEEDAG